MLKIFALLCVFFSPVLLISLEEVKNSTISIYSTLNNNTNNSTTVAPKKNGSCDTSYDCIDLRMVCSKNRTCICAKFHDRLGQKCKANITKIYQWFRGTMSTDPETVSQPLDFQVVQSEPFTILVSRWSEYKNDVHDAETKGIPRAYWPILFGIVLIIVAYVAILLKIL